MNVTELTREQLDELKTSYYCHVLHAGEGISWDDLLHAANEVEDETMYHYYADSVFVNDDFLCSAII